MTFKVGDKVRLNERGKRQGYVSVVPKVVYEVTSVTTRKEITLKGVYAQWAVENWELVEDKMKYKVGDKARIVANHSSHKFDDGDIVVINTEVSEGEYRAYLFQDPSEVWYVAEDDIEPFITLPEHLTKSPVGIVDKYYEDSVKIKPHGGPSSYYDMPFNEWTTVNDQMEYLAENKWGKFGIHLKDIHKGLCRWGDKPGTTVLYDTKKIIYYGVRVLRMLSGKKGVQDYLKELLNDPQFKDY